jgi:hypothetical protein
MEVPSILGSRFLVGNPLRPNIKKYEEQFVDECKWDDATFAYNLQPYFVPTRRNKTKIFGNMTA